MLDPSIRSVHVKERQFTTTLTNSLCVLLPSHLRSTQSANVYYILHPRSFMRRNPGLR